MVHMYVYQPFRVIVKGEKEVTYECAHEKKKKKKKRNSRWGKDFILSLIGLLFAPVLNHTESLCL